MAIAARANDLARRLPTWPVYVAGAVLPVMLAWQAAFGDLGPDPAKVIEKTLGLWALKLVIAGLAITPIRRLSGINLVKFRRAIALVAFFYVALHLAAWLVLDMGLLWDQALADIFKRPYVTIGMAGFVMMVPLALTSNNWSIRRLGAARWRKLHLLAYPAALAGAVHYIWLVKSWPVEPFLYLAAILLLLALRLRAPRIPA
jgi:sulfoxide reductase heme-binding subunit YedZ